MQHAKAKVASFLGDEKDVLFIPYAGVTVSYDDYTDHVQNALADFSINIIGIHTRTSALEAVQQAKAIAVGGGNTFRLLKQLYENNLIEAIREKVKSGTKFIGWSAGSNVAGPGIFTTNDMPIVEPPSFKSLGFVPFQINPHYTEQALENHGGETRKARLLEFIKLNTTDVVCLPEGTWLETKDGATEFGGGSSFKVYRHPDQVFEVEADASKDFLNRV
jgi:dipeptidase E